MGRPTNVMICAAAALALAGCGLPRSGPYVEELTASAEGVSAGITLIPVDMQVAAIAQAPDHIPFGPEFLAASEENYDLVGHGDLLAVSIWEANENAIFAPDGARVARIDAVTVDGRGRIYLPFVGMVRAAGRTPDQIREVIRSALVGKTLDPQVEVRVAERRSRAVTVSGVVARNGVYPLERNNGRLLSTISLAGGVSEDPLSVRVKLRRGESEGVAWLQEVYNDAALDVPLRAGDTVIVERDARSFTALGAVGAQSLVPFPKPAMTALEALAAARGLQDEAADPTGVFVFRSESAETLAALGRDPAAAAGRTAYLIDLTSGEGLFAADAFEIRDGDSIFVTSAPFTRWRKILGAVVPTVNFAASTATLGGI